MNKHDSQTLKQPDIEVQQDDKWKSNTYYSENTISPGKDRPQNQCFLYRGQQNLLTRFRNGTETNPPADDIRQEIRALAARWLKMQNLCVLLGAGSSKYITKFISSGLYERVRRLIEGYDSLSHLNALISLSSNPDKIGYRFEQFLSQLSLFVRLSDSSTWPLDKWEFDFPISNIRGAKNRKKALTNLLLNIERAVAVVCNVDLPQSALTLSEESPTAHEMFLSKLVERDPQCGRGKIFTTNYDTLIEQALDRLGIIYCDGFTGSVQRRFNPAGYDLDLHYPGETTEGRVRRYDKVLQLFKLHGSINWRKTATSAQNPYGISFSNAPLPKESDILADISGKKIILSNVFEKGESLEILPTAAKYGESLGMPYAHMFRALGISLREPQTVLFIIGYSGWDLHINQMIEDALTNPSFTCVIVDPIPSDWAQCICRSDYCGRVYCFGGPWGTFEFFASEILPDVEVLKTDLAIAKTIKELKKGSESEPKN